MIWYKFYRWLVTSILFYPIYLSKSLYILYRVHKKHSHDDMDEKVIDRWCSYNHYKTQKLEKEITKMKWKALVEMSDKTGIPQWDLRKYFDL